MSLCRGSMGKMFCKKKERIVLLSTYFVYFAALLLFLMFFTSSSSLTKTRTAGSRLSIGKSGRPKLEDSWEHSVVANDSSWDTLKHKINHDTAVFTLFGLHLKVLYIFQIKKCINFSIWQWRRWELEHFLLGGRSM